MRTLPRSPPPSPPRSPPRSPLRSPLRHGLAIPCAASPSAPIFKVIRDSYQPCADVGQPASQSEASCGARAQQTSAPDYTPPHYAPAMECADADTAARHL